MEDTGRAVGAPAVGVLVAGGGKRRIFAKRGSDRDEEDVVGGGTAPRRVKIVEEEGKSYDGDLGCR